MANDAPPGLAGNPTPPTPDPAQQQAAMQQFGKMIGQAVTQAVQQQVAPLAKELADLKAGIAPKANGTPPPANEELDKMLLDPRAYVRKINEESFEQQAGQKIAPVLMPALETIKENAEDQQRSRVDSLFGEGTWSELFLEPYQTEIAHVAQVGGEAARYNPKSITAVIDRLIGSEGLRQDLEKRRTTLLRKRDEEERSRPPSFLGTPGRTRMAEEPFELTRDDREVLDSLEKAGIKDFGEDNIKLMRQIPKTADVDTQLRAYEKLTGAKK